MSSIDTSNNANYLIPSKYKIDKPDFTKLKSAKEADTSVDELFKNRAGTISDCDSNMFKDLYGFYNNLNVASPMIYKDATKDLDAFVDAVKKHTEYINKNFQGDEKEKYLSALNSCVNNAKTGISSNIAFGLVNFLGLDKKDLTDITSTIDSIINDQINGVSSTKKVTSLKDMDYKSLKTLSAGIESISNDLSSTIFSGSGDVNSYISALGLAKLKSNFLSEKTNLSSSIKKQLSDAVDLKVETGITDIINTQKFARHLRTVWAHEKNMSLGDIEGINGDQFLENLKERTNKMYKDFSSIKFNKYFMNNMFDLVQLINKQYSKDINYYENVDNKLGTGISSSLSKSQKSLTDNINSSWNDFIRKVSAADGDDNSQYYLPSSSHNIVDLLA